jgi:hypothetical protein
MQRITRVDPESVGKVCAFLFFLFGLLSALFVVGVEVFFAKGEAVRGLWHVHILTLVFGPFIYALVGAITGFIGAWFYNITVRFSGGLVIETEEKKGFSSITDPS